MRLTKGNQIFRENNLTHKVDALTLERLGLMMVRFKVIKEGGSLVVPPEYANFFIASAGAGAALVGLLFVAVSLAPEQIVARRAPVERQAAAGSAFTALITARSLLSARRAHPRSLVCARVCRGDVCSPL